MRMETRTLTLLTSLQQPTASTNLSACFQAALTGTAQPMELAETETAQWNSRSSASLRDGMQSCGQHHTYGPVSQTSTAILQQSTKDQQSTRNKTGRNLSFLF